MAIDKDQALRRPGNLSRKGRPKGSKNLRPHKDIFSRCWEANFDPMQSIITIAQGELKCLVCRGELTTRYPVTDAQGDRVYDEEGNIKTAHSLCRSCYGTGWEHLDPNHVLKANEMLMARMYPVLKQVDHTNADGSMRPKWEMVIVQSPQTPQFPQGAAGGSSPPQLMQKEEDGWK